MDGKFLTHLDYSATMTQPLRFASDVGPLFADCSDDATFLEESWTLGVHAAAENLQRRRQSKADRENQARAFSELQRLATLRVVEDRQLDADSALADRAAAVVDRYDATSSQSWSPQDWTPEDRIAQRWIPQGWMPSDMSQHEAPQAKPIGEPHNKTMTPQRARLLLEVASTSTREQIRSAYRRMVGQWHPDRLQFTSDAIRTHATRHMAELNEAYRLLCSTELEQAA